MVALLAIACSKPTHLEVLDAPTLDAPSVSTPPRCRPPGRGSLPVVLEPAYRSLTFTAPVDVVRAPGDPAHVYIVEAAGTVRVTTDDPDAGDAPIFLDVTAHLFGAQGDVGLWDVAFHPRYPDVPFVFAFFSGAGGSTGFRSVLVRFTTRDDGSIDPGSEQILMSIERIPGSAHSAGKIGFAADGTLLISTGDGDGYGDPFGRAQDPQSLLGKMLRIDVDGPGPYAIPADNPFAGTGGAPEVYALGFRNPWRWSFDRATGDIWLGDVGHERIEEINRIVPGGNYGWKMREGSLCWAETPCLGSFIDPEFEYGHTQGSSVIGGYVYRGTRIPELAGRYVFGDYTSGRIWALDGGGAELLVESGLGIGAFAEDPDGELLVTDVATGRIFRLVPSELTAPGVPAPFLRLTGCIDDPARVPYEVNAPLWSDGLDKVRAMVLPLGGRATVEIDGHWDLPADTVLSKTFSYGDRRVETRLLVRGEDGSWAGWAYRWNPDGLDAVRVDDGALVDLGDRQWSIPSTAECSRCHSYAAGHALGLEQAQLDRGDQLAVLAERGVFDGSRVAVSPLARLDDAASIEHRARSYLHVNCSVCHRPGGLAPGDLDLRASVPLVETNACDRVPAFGRAGLAVDARVIAPGDPARSVLLARMANRGVDQMPPLGTHVTDAAALAVIATWIESSSSCAQGAQSAP